MIKFTRETSETSYSRLDAYMEKKGYSETAARNIQLVFDISQSEEVESVSEFLSGRELPIVESFHNLDASIEILKFGFYKQVFASLRMGLDNGLLSAYWNAVGYDRPELTQWINSKKKTPRKNRRFWEPILKLPGVECFFGRFFFTDKINGLSEQLNNYIHTKGRRYSTLCSSWRKSCDEWYELFVASTRIIVTLQLLVKPKLAIVVPDEFLLRKFGSYDHIPFCGVLLGDYSDRLKLCVGESEYNAMSTIACTRNEVKDVWNYLEGCPDLTDGEIRKLNREFWKSAGLDDDTVEINVDETLRSIREFETQ